MVDEFDGEEYELRAVVDAAQTPPFLTERRIVVGRGIGRFTADELAPLVDYLGRSAAVDRAGARRRRRPDAQVAHRRRQADRRRRHRPRRHRRAGPGTARRGSPSEAAAGGVRFDPAAASAVAERLGEDVGRLDGILATLVSTYGTSRRADRRRRRAVPRRGRRRAAVGPHRRRRRRRDDQARSRCWRRMTGAGDRHPLQVMAVLHNHYVRLARLDGVDARSEADAAEALGIKPGFPAKKALGSTAGSVGAGIQRAIELLAQADLDLRGATELPDDVVMEVLVARLSRLAR